MSFSIGCECEQGFVLPGFNLQEQPASIDYDISACIRCNVDSFTLLERAQERDMLDPSSISTVPLGLSVGGPSTA